MKKIRALLISIFAFMLAIVCLSACSADFFGGTQEDDPVEDTDTDNTKKKKHLITFVMRTGSFSQLLTEGEIPVPPAEEEILADAEILYVTGWDKEIVPVTGAQTYRAQYASRTRYYTVTYKSYNDEIVDTEATYRSKPVLPETVQTPEGFEFVCWDAPSIITSDTVCQAVYSKYLTKDTMSLVFKRDLMAFVEDEDNKGDIRNGATAFLALALEEFYNPMQGAVRDRVLLHLRNLIAGGNEPMFDSLPLWQYVPVSAGIALAKKTPSVWGELTEDEVARLDLIMRCFAIISCHGTDDENFYETGPGLGGNYKKVWNPNYRLANVLPIVFCKDYFGGTKAVNDIFASFNYDAYMLQFKGYGFTRVQSCWGKPTRNEIMADGTEVTIYGARDLFTNGGATYCYDSKNNNAVKYAGEGVGVKGNVYTYQGCSLDNVAGIVKALYTHNYSGGFARNQQLGTDNSTVIAYIREGASTPVLGFDGMMLELGSPTRSSISYCSHDFMLVMSSLEVMKALGMYDITADIELYTKMIVGNADFLYKCEVGYYSFAQYSNSTSFDLVDESSLLEYYFVWKSIFREYYPSHPDDIK